MIVVLIERQIAEGCLTEYKRVITSMKRGVSKARGFIEANSYALLEDHKHRWPVVHFDCLQNWQRWQNSKERKMLLDAIYPLLVCEEIVTILEQQTR